MKPFGVCVCVKTLLIWLEEIRNSEAALPLPGKKLVIWRQLWAQRSSISQSILIGPFTSASSFFVYSVIRCANSGKNSQTHFWIPKTVEEAEHPHVVKSPWTLTSHSGEGSSTCFLNFVKRYSTFLQLFRDSGSLGARHRTQRIDTDQSLTSWKVQEQVRVELNHFAVHLKQTAHDRSSLLEHKI